VRHSHVADFWGGPCRRGWCAAALLVGCGMASALPGAWFVTFALHEGYGLAGGMTMRFA